MTAKIIPFRPQRIIEASQEIFNRRANDDDEIQGVLSNLEWCKTKLSEGFPKVFKKVFDFTREDILCEEIEMLLMEAISDYNEANMNVRSKIDPFTIIKAYRDRIIDTVRNHDVTE